MKLTIVPVSDAERGRGTLTPETTLIALTALHEQGTVILRGIYPAAFIDQLYQEFCNRYGGQGLAGMSALSQAPFPNPVQKVGDGRFEIAMRMTGPFGQPLLFGNPLLVNFLGPLLGNDLMRLGSVTAVASFPGAEMQHIHRDHQQLFHEFAQIGPALPLYAVNCSIPLIDIDAVMGPTAIWPGSHRWSEKQEASPHQGMASVPFQRGDAVLMDYRTMHTGLPNNSQTVRPILYLVYTREWFFDDNNHRGRAPLDIPLDHLQLLPADLRALMMRAFQQQVRARQLNAP
jgi:hypothetical protein